MPFRNKNMLTRKQIFTFSSIGTISFLVIGLLGHKTDGFLNQMLKYKFTAAEISQVSLVYDATNYDMYEKMAVKDCNIWVRDTKNIDARIVEECFEKHGKAVVVLGDSHAMNLFNIISRSNATHS